MHGDADESSQELANPLAHAIDMMHALPPVAEQLQGQKLQPTHDTSAAKKHVRAAVEHRLDRETALEDMAGAQSTRATARALNAVFGGSIGDVIEQAYLLMNTLQSLALFTLPDFIDWPEEWLRFLPNWLQLFSFGLFELLLPQSHGMALASSLSLPVAILGRGVYLRIRLGDRGYRLAWRKSNSANGRARTRKRLVVGCLGLPLGVLFVFISMIEAFDGGIFEDNVMQSGGSGSLNWADSDDDPVLRMDVSLVCVFAMITCGCGVTMLGHNYLVRALRRSFDADGGSEFDDDEFFRAWLYWEVSLLAFLYSATYIGAVTTCLKYMVSLDRNDTWLALTILCGYGGAAVLFFKALKDNRFVLDSQLWERYNFKGIFCYFIVVICCSIPFALESSTSGTIVVLSWYLVPPYTVAPVVLLAHATRESREYCLAQTHLNVADIDEKTWVELLDVAKQHNTADLKKVNAAAYLTLIQSYELRYWCEDCI
eukprot:COSAG01_NODE_2167_length_8252_cov_3.073961_3_plen_485_part_00